VSSFTELVERSVRAGEPTEMAPVPAPAVSGGRRWVGWLGVVLLYLASFAVAFGLSALFVALTGNSPRDVVTAMYNGSLADGSSLGQTID
jgi:hypothetical protein